jgi:REP element-mobilizing transposase RayT
MKYEPTVVRATGRSPQRNRRSIRLQGYDYSQAGAYFITVCTQNRECLFGDIVDGEMRLNEAGRTVADEWLKTAEIRVEIELDEWVVMPNHFHGILVITHDGGETDCRGDRRVAPMNGTTISGEQGDRRVAPTGPQPRSVGAVMAGFKSAATKRINELRQTPGTKLWQRNYWEHIIRNEPELKRIREYIHNNPAQWELDQLHPGTGDRRVAPTEIREPVTEYGMEEWVV